MRAHQPSEQGSIHEWPLWCLSHFPASATLASIAIAAAMTRRIVRAFNRAVMVNIVK